MINSRFIFSKFEKRSICQTISSLNKQTLGCHKILVLRGDDGFKTIILLFQHSLQLMCVAPLSL